MKTSTLILAAFSFASFAGAESVKDREGAVRNDKATMEKSGRWIYNDIDAAFARAKETGKPLMVVLRCVPCVSCMELDADVVELKHVGQFGPHATAKNTGFQVNDVIVELDGKTQCMSESAMLCNLIQHKKPGENRGPARRSTRGAAVADAVRRHET